MILVPAQTFSDAKKNKKINDIMFLKIKLVTIVEGDLKALFSKSSTPRCRGGRYFFPWIAPL